MTDEPVRALSFTEYAVLGLLMSGERSGYDLHKLASHTIAYFWRPAKSKIYSALPRLASAGLIEATAVVARERRPDKQLYRITPRGEAALRAWLASDDIVVAPGRHGLLLKIFFGEHGDLDAIRGHLVRWRERAVAQLAELEQIERGVDRERAFFPYLTLLHGLEDARSTVAWADRALAALDERTQQSLRR
jgi:DNA-binding PadR family transcriptional regulator